MAPQIRACHFPATGRHRGTTKRLLSIRVDYQHRDPLQKAFDLDGSAEALSAVVRAAWALTLRCYTGLDEVCFGFEETRRSSDGAPSAPITVVALINGNSTLRQLIELCSGGQYLCPDPVDYNTSVLVRYSIPSVSGNPSSSSLPTALSEKCQIRLLLKVLKSGPSVFLEYRNSFIPTEQAKNIASTVSKLLADVLLLPDVPIRNLSFLSEYNKSQIDQWNSAPLPLIEKTIHGLIYETCKKFPYNEAVCSWDGNLSYQELDEKACRLAAHLIGLGVGAESVVPLCFEKSKWNIVAVLATLYAGGAFLPLDPAYPEDRVRHLVHSTSANVIMCSRPQLARMAGFLHNVIPVDQGLLDSLAIVEERPESTVASHNSAYIIPTSGTTGQPKLSVMEHRNFCTATQGHMTALLLDSTKPLRAFQFAAHSFDASITEFLSPLIVGGTICIPDEHTRLNDLAKAICSTGATWAQLTPTLVRFLEPAMVPSLASLILMGEAMTEKNLEVWSTIRLVNGYGPSECSVCSVANPACSRETDPRNIGSSVSCRVWVVDVEDHHRLSPIGCVGELLIEGHIVGRGYLNDPGKTSDVFVDHAGFAGSRAFRGYLTGDLVVQNPDGSLNIMGRKDSQVKYHGQRIELLEIEHHISRHPWTKHNLVLLPKEGLFKDRLVAAVAPIQAANGREEFALVTGKERIAVEPELESARTQMCENLPPYMIPTVWIPVFALPRLSSGKLDRKKVSQWLIAIDADTYEQIIRGPETTLTSATPKTAVESTLRGIWAHVLNLPEEKVSLDRSFLSLGGDSISAMQVMGSCRKKGIGLSVQDILRSKSIAHLAGAVKEVSTEGGEAQEESRHNFDLGPIQSLWIQLPNQGLGHFNQSFYLKVEKRISVEQFQLAVETLVSRHSMLRARFSQSDRRWQQQVTSNIQDSYRFRAHQVSSKQQLHHLIAESQQCLNFTNGPLFAADLFDIDEEQHAFLVGHHLVIDLVSWRVLLEELEELLQGGNLLPPPLSFQKWHQLQQAHAQSLQLEGVLPRVDVPPLDFSYWGIQHIDNTYGNAAHESFELDAFVTSDFISNCHVSMKTEPVEVLLAALIHSWSKVFSDRPMPAIFNEGHGREPWDISIDISRTVGWFTTLVPIAIPSANNMIDVVRYVKDFRREIPGNGRPYFAARCLTFEGRDQFRTHWPMEVSFNYLGQYQQLEREDALLKPLETMAGETREAGGTADVGHDAPRFALFEISAIVFKGRLKFAFTFNRHMRHQDTIRRWVSECHRTCVEMVQALANSSPTPTRSDFPLLCLTDSRFQSMLSRLSGLGIHPSNVEDAYPCSSMQEGLLVAQMKSSGFYAAVTIHEVILRAGRPDWEKLVNAWKSVVARHTALRTIFVEDLATDDTLYGQVVLKQTNANISHVECESKEQALRVLNEQQSATLSLGRAPPHRFTICYTPDGHVFCCLQINHVIMDGQSMSVIFHDLQRAYTKSLHDDAPSYGDYITFLRNNPRDASLAYWKDYLSGSEVCSFPTLNDGIEVREKQLRSLRLDLGTLSIRDLQSFSITHGITLSNMFHAAWALTISLYIGSKDVVFGYLTSARDDQGIYRVEEMVGPLINTLVCRVRLSDETESLLDILQAIQKDYLDMLPHRHTSLAEVQHALGLGSNALFNTALSYRRLPARSASQEETVNFVEVVPIYDPTEYCVSLNIEVSDDVAIIDLDYWNDHVSDAQAANIASTLIRALENIVHHSHDNLDSLDHLSGTQWQQISSWNLMPETLYECVHDRFSSWVKQQPDAPAIRGFDGDYTYAELDDITSRLAHYLVEVGVGPEIFVPTCFDKSSCAVVAMLSVLKAGGAAVPLDAKHPKHALDLRIEDTRAEIVLTSAERAELFEEIVPDVIIVDEVLLDDLRSRQFSPAPACTDVQPSNPAFVIFTSGSTGRPKGVILEHAAMVTSANAHGSNLRIGPGSRFLQFASYTFDNSLEEMFTSLQRGGCVCVPSEEQRMSDLAKAIAELDANFMDLTPTVAALLDPSSVPSIKGMALGGEALTKAVVDQWSPHVHLHGQYGPSETSINSAWKDFQDGGDPTNIGRAIGSVSWLVDPDNRDRLVPIGCKGELLIEGPILSRGYLNDPEKTAAAFIKDPAWAHSSGTSGRRFYCTGDLVQYTPAGEMIYLGRKDNQVKINGQRVEIGEIEHHLKLNLPSESQSAVELVVFQGENRFKALVAFLYLPHILTASTEEQPRVVGHIDDAVREICKHLERELAAALPNYYVPSVFMPVTSMPMTTSGKLNRKILRQMAQSVPSDKLHAYRLAGQSGRSPQGFAETVLAILWVTILNLNSDSVYAEDSFFRLGGDSLGAMRLVTASRKEGVQLTVGSIFAHPTLAAMAASCTVLDSKAISEKAEDDLVPFELIQEDVRNKIIEFAAAEIGVFPDAIEDIYPCSRLQGGLIAVSTKEPGAYVAETIYRLPHDVDIKRFRKAWDTVFAAEPILRTRIVHDDVCGFLQVVIQDSIRWQAMHSVEEIRDADRYLPSTPGGPLASYTIVGEGTDCRFFVWTAHHAIYDGWSLPALLCKVESCYHAAQPSIGSSAPFSRFIKYLSTIDEAESDTYWKTTFDGITASSFPQLPFPDHIVQASKHLEHRVSVVRRSGSDITMPSTIRAAWGLLLSIYSGSKDVVWGETTSGREIPVNEIENVIGPTIATSPIRLILDRQSSIQDYLHEVQERAAAALPYQFAGLQHIRKLSSDTSAACQFQSLLAIVAGDGMKDLDGGFWNLQSTGTIGTNFFNYSLVFNCTVSKDAVDIEASYDDQVLQPWLVQRLLDEFDYLINCLNSTEKQHRNLSDLELLNESDKKALMSWNHKPVSVINRCIHTVIHQEQCILRPSAIAIDAWDMGKMTYRELDERSSRLASKLISLGVQPRAFVPICFDKSGWTIVAMLAVLKCGAAFVPLDFESPLLRLREIVGDVSAQMILCGRNYEQLCSSIPSSTFVVERESTDRHAERLYTLPCVQSDSPAYVIFTSGSTGKPKGAVISHRSWVSSSTAFAPAMGLSESSRVLQFASYTFDACLIEILSTLMVGGTVCVPDQASRTDDLTGVINGLEVNWATLTPTVVRTIQPPQVTGLKALILIGEPMSQQDLLTWADRLLLGNGYGPTECSAIATVNIMTSSTKPNNLGKAITARGWIVCNDDHAQLVPLGAVGELVLEGGGVGIGYLNDSEKTAMAFMKPPKWAVGPKSGSERTVPRFYKTGDLVRYNEDGTLLYLGRKDSQTKVRGQRLELSEVEHHLISDSSVQNALATVPASGPCAKRLVGVLSLRGVNMSKFSETGNEELQLLPAELVSLNIASIRDRIYDRLPAYMVPSLWVALAAFPLMPSGKMNRRRIVRWLEEMNNDTYRLVSTIGLETPMKEADGVEQRLQGIFAKVLNLPIEDIRVTQSFLHLGGDSIAAMRVASSCRTQGLAITVQDIIRSKSISVLASKISTARKDEPSQASEENHLPFELTPVQRTFFDTVGHAYTHFNQSVILRIKHSFTAQEIENALVSLVSIHPLLKGRYEQNESRKWHQRIHTDENGSFRLRHHDVNTNINATIQRIADESQSTLDIIRGPVFSIDLMDIKEDFSQVIALVAHHLVVDVVSWGIILEDLQSLLNGTKPPPQSIPFRDWQKRQAEQAKAETARRVYPVSAIPPADFEYWGMADKENLYGDVVSECIELSPKDTMLLLGAHDALSTEPVDVFIAALIESFRTVFPDRPTVTIHNEGHGRESASVDLSRTVGWFTTMCPIHLPLAVGEPTDIISTIRWVKDLRERIPGKGQPYYAYRLLTDEGRERFASHWPAEAVFNYLGRLQNLERKDALLQKMDNITSSDVGTDVPRFSLFEITALVAQGTIQISFGYNRHMSRQPDIKRWAAECRTTLVHAVDQLLQARQEPSLSDFKLLPLSYNGMSRLSAVLPANTYITDIEDIYPASPMQQGILLSQLKHPELYAYHCTLEVRSTHAGQTVDPRGLADAWQVVVHRHPALRTVFVESLSKTGLMDQIVFKEKSGRISWISGCKDDDAARVLRELPSLDYREFNTPHLFTICKTQEGKVWVRLEMSHAICDGSSIPNILRDLAKAYEGKLTRAERGPLYSDFISHILSSSRDNDLQYWRTYLSGVEPCFFPNLVDGHPGPHELHSCEIHLSNTAAIQALCKRKGVTFSNVLQLAWSLLLHSYVGSSDVSFGVVSSGRDVPVRNIEDATGCFVNMLICRLQVTDNARVFELLESLQSNSVDAMAHQSCSLAEVQHELQSPALFNTVFTFQRRQLSKDPEKMALAYESVEAADPGEYHITVNVDVTPETASVDFGFWKDKVCPAQAQNLIQTFQQIVTSICQVSDDSVTVADLDFLSEGSLMKIAEWNCNLPPPIQRCVHDLIQDQVLIRPRSTRAIESWDGTFTYQEFDEATDRIAAHLIAVGVSTEDFVPILFEKSSWAIVAMISIMKAGGAYVPLDPKHPPARLRQLIADVRAPVVLCSRNYLPRAVEVASSAVVVDRETLDALPIVRGPQARGVVTPENAAYCLFTSGTTGKPKGTIIPHQAFCTSAAAFTPLMFIDSTTRTFQFASYTFDASCAEILAALTVGATVCVPNEEERMNDPAGAIRRLGMTWSFLTPAVLGAMKLERIPSLKTLVVGGEAVPAPIITKWAKYTCLIEAYGPTETTVFATAGLKSTLDKELINKDPATIGSALGCRLWIVHPANHDKLVPVGAVGELCIEGYTAARGYLGDQVKTSQAFISTPRWATEGSIQTTRIYKSGDLVRYNSDGTVSYIGRKDTQVKLNGQRIELGEIEYQVKSKFPDTVQSAVDLVAPASRNSTKALAVFFCIQATNEDGLPPSTQPQPLQFSAADDLLLPMDENLCDMCKRTENALAGLLPSYMIPSIFIPISKMPWTTASKLDRNRLRNIVQNMSKESLTPYRLSSTVNKRLPRNSTERLLQRLVANVLNLQPAAVGLDDNFIRLGGDSITAMRLVAAAQAENIELSVMDIFKHPKLSELAASNVITRKEGFPTESIEPFQLLGEPTSLSQVLEQLAAQFRVPQSMIQDAYPASPLQEALVTLSNKQPGAYVAQYVLELSPTTDIARLKAAWEKAIQDTDLLRTRIAQTSAGSFIQAVLTEDPITWYETSTLETAEEQVLKIPSHVGGQLASYAVVRKSTDQTYMVWTIHHALYDGWSIPHMLHKVEQIYHTGMVKAPKVPYSRFIKYLRDADPEVSKRFWKANFSGVSAYHFPHRTQAAPSTSPRGRTLQHTAKLSPGNHGGITPSTTIRAAWAILLSAYTNAEEVVFGETLTGRDIPVAGVTDICGPTLTTVPIRVAVYPDMAIVDLLEGIANHSTDRIPYQHFGLSEIRKIDEDTGTACNFQNLLAIQIGGQQPSETMWRFHNTGIQSNYFTYPLVIECHADKSSVGITAHYDEHCLSSWQVHRILLQMESILSQLNSAQKVRDIQLLSEQDVQAMKGWNSYEPQLVDDTMHSLFLKQVALRPNATAVAAHDGEFTYADVLDFASRLAFKLISHGAGPGTLIPVCLMKSKWAVVAIMAVLLSGAAYVPLSPEHPSERHRQVCSDCKASIVLCSPGYEKRFSSIAPTLLTVNESSIHKIPPSQTPPLVQCTGADICYVLYTSGSTGVPKGVIVEHRAIASSSAAICKTLHMDNTSRVFQFGSFVFDASVMEILTTLSCGATVCIPSEEERTADIASAINRLRVTWTCLTPSVANVIDSPKTVPTLKTLASGAEALTAETITKWGGALEILNAYGPTEASVVAVSNDQVSLHGDPSEIGRALPSARAWVLRPDDPQALAPLGAIGELAIEGPILARGYLNNRIKTAEVFIEDPVFMRRFFPKKQTRIYRTGDLVQFTEYGTIRYLGRKDNQIKLAGQRIELGEIEAVLRKDAEVHNAVVIMPKSGPAKKKLVAVVALSSKTIDAGSGKAPWNTPLIDSAALKQVAAVKAKLSDLLPPYMVPGVWIAVQSIPVLASAKLDRKQVATWFEGIGEQTYRHILGSEEVDELVAQGSEALSKLQEVWSKVLNVPIRNVKPSKSWLSLGGDSITAMQMIARMRKERIPLTLNQVLRSKSLAHLVSGISATTTDIHHHIETTDVLFELSPIQRFYFKSIGDDKNAHFNQSSTLRLSRTTDTELIKSAINAVVTCHSMLRARFCRAKSGHWVQKISGAAPEAYAFEVYPVQNYSEMVDIISNTQRSLDIVHGPVFSVNLFQMPSKEQVLFMVAHHLVVDVVSWKIIVGDIEDYVHSDCKDTPRPGLPFAFWCEKQMDATKDPVHSRLKVQPVDLSFWGLADRPNIYGDAEHDSFYLDKNHTVDALRHHGALRTETVDLLVAAIVHSFSRVFVTRPAPTVFNESHGRSNNDDLSRTVGWFTTMQPISIEIPKDEDDVVHTVRKVKDARRNIPDNGRSYFADRFLTENGQLRYADHDPAEILFNYLGQSRQLSDDGSIFLPMRFNADEEVKMSDLGNEARRPALFEISASVDEDRLHFRFTYNILMKNQKGIRRWIAECQRTMEEIVKILRNAKACLPTLSDFPLLPLESYNRLDRVLATLPKVGIPSYDLVEDIYPCASVQEGMILAQIKDPESYLSFSTFEVKAKGGYADVQRVAASWQKVVNRHPALRTVFIDSVCKGGVFDQVVLKKPDSGVVLLTCKDSELRTRLDSIKYSELNGKKKPRLPHQLSVIQTEAGRVIVKMEINHAVIDGGSHAVIRRDLELAYQDLLSEEEGPLYSDYIKHIRSLSMDTATQFWKKKLQGLRPCYFPVASQHSTKQRRLQSMYMEFKLYSEVQAFAEKERITFANIMLSVWALVLRTFTGSSDVCYGYLTSGRNIPVDGIESAVGAFINMLVSRVQVSLDQPILSVCNQVQIDFLESLPYQHCSLAQFQHDLGLSGKPLFNTAVSIQNHGAVEDRTNAQPPVEFIHFDAHDPSEFAITVNIDATQNDEGVRFSYWSDEISDDVAKRICTTMANILTVVLNEPSVTIGDIDKAIAQKSHETHKRPTRPSFSRSWSSMSSAAGGGHRTLRTPRYEISDPLPRIELPGTSDAPEWGNLIRNIVSEMVPQIVDQMLAKNKYAPQPAQSTIDDMANQMVGMLSRKASQSLRPRQLETGSVRGRRMSVASEAENRINIAADMVAAAGVMATEKLKSVPPDFVEKKLLALWSDLLDTVEDSIGNDDSFFQLGGDSIIAMRLVGAAREEGLAMTVADVFRNPTFSDMARVVRVAGEVIDEVMSRHGGDSVVAGPSRPSFQRQASTAWEDFKSIISEHMIDEEDHSSDTIAKEKTDHDAKAQSEQLFKTWHGFSANARGGTRSQTESQRRQRTAAVQTIPEAPPSTTRTISLLGDPGVKSVISKVQVFKGGISDVFPVTDFQALAITGTLLESRWMLNYFYLDGGGPLDLRKLKQTAFRVVQAFDILRTVFIPYGDRFLQVVLRKLQPEFIFQETDKDLDDFTAGLRQRDREHGPRLGEPFVQFVVAKKKSTEHYRIFMRLSHAQYDGFCLTKILGALQDGYNGLPISSAPSFGTYVRESAKIVTGAHDHWREVLRGSTMTEIVQRYGPNYQRSAGQTVTLKRTLTIPSLSRINITVATVMKAAWASTLARLVGKSDIIFGHVVSGRNSGVPRVEQIIGPCLNMVPVRVVYRPEWTVLDLLTYIQDQQIGSLSYESLGFREITRDCTDWPDWTTFSSVIQHNQNIHSDDAKLQLGGLEYKVGASGSQEDFADISILSISRGDNKIEVSFTYAPNSTITSQYASDVFDMFCLTAITFANDPDTLLPSPSELTSESSTTLHSDKSHKKAVEKQALALPSDTGLSKFEISALASTLRSAWEQILRDTSGGLVSTELGSNFFELGGDIMGLAQVASILDQGGLKIRVEDLIDKPVFVNQVSLLAVEKKKMLERENMNPWGDKAKGKSHETKEKGLQRTQSGLGLSALVKKMGLKRKGTA